MSATTRISDDTLSRLLHAWDATVLPVSNDGLLQERMEDLRAAMAAPATAPDEPERLRKDAERLDWMQRQDAANLISDDGGKWAISDSGFQPVPEEGGFKKPVTISSLVFPDDWRPTIREAIDAAIAKAEGRKE